MPDIHFLWCKRGFTAFNNAVRSINVVKMTRPNNVKIRVRWLAKRPLAKNAILFCIDGRCMSGRVTELDSLGDDQFEIAVRFIEPSYFNEYYQVGRKITLQEASKVLGEGVISQILEIN